MGKHRQQNYLANILAFSIVTAQSQTVFVCIGPRNGWFPAPVWDLIVCIKSPSSLHEISILILYHPWPKGVEAPTPKACQCIYNHDCLSYHWRQSKVHNMPNDICLQCKQKPKRQDYTFCSPQCSKKAADNAPNLLNIPHDHVMFHDGLYDPQHLNST